jgi:hypothetical protein
MLNDELGDEALFREEEDRGALVVPLTVLLLLMVVAFVSRYGPPGASAPRRAPRRLTSGSAAAW